MGMRTGKTDNETVGMMSDYLCCVSLCECVCVSFCSLCFGTEGGLVLICETVRFCSVNSDVSRSGRIRYRLRRGGNKARNYKVTRPHCHI